MQIRRKDDIKQLGTILSIWAHPDDESFTCAGLLRMAVENGQQVICVTATRGEKGVQDEARWPAARLGEIREQELEQALQILGITKHHWLGYADGTCQDVPEQEAVAKIADLIKQYQPDTIITFGPDGLTGHTDHASVSRWTDQAVDSAKSSKVAVYQVVQTEAAYERMRKADEELNIFFNTDKPPLVDEAACDILLNLEGEVLDKKYDCLRVQPSQMEAMLTRFDRNYICNMLRTESFRKGQFRSAVS